MIVLVWLMDERWVYQKIVDGISDMELEAKSFSLVCDQNAFINRWENDKNCEWRTTEWLTASLKSLPHFSSLENCIDTSDLKIDATCDMIMRKIFEESEKADGLH